MVIYDCFMSILDCFQCWYQTSSHSSRASLLPTSNPPQQSKISRCLDNVWSTLKYLVCCRCFDGCCWDSDPIKQFELHLSGSPDAIKTVFHLFPDHNPKIMTNGFRLVYSFDTIEEAEVCQKQYQSILSFKHPNEWIKFDMFETYLFDNQESAKRYYSKLPDQDKHARGYTLMI